MKKLNYVVLSLLAIGITVFACTKDDTATSATETAKKDIIKPSGVISPERAAALDAEWSKTRATSLRNSKTGEADNRSSWWSLEDMRNYLDYAEQQAETLGYTMDGVRVYYAAYPAEDDSEHAGQATLFMVPTSSEVGLKDGSGASFRTGSGDVPGGDPLNQGAGGYPPSANYPQ